MSTQWHPLFARLLRLLLEDFYQVDVEVPVSDLPRKGDLVLLRKSGSGEPPFTGLWLHLTEWNLLEFKGPTDSPEEADLDLLIHVGTGIGYRFNEERQQHQQERVPNRHFSLWYLAPRLGETFLEHARSRTNLVYETGGLWRGWGWEHPVFLVGYRDAPMEADTVPLHLLMQPPATPPPSLVELLARRTDLLQRYDSWLFALYPDLWKEVRAMTQTTSETPNWAAVMDLVDVKSLVHAIGEERVIQILGKERLVQTLGIDRAIEALGLERVIAALGPEQVIAALGPEQVIAALGPERVLEAALSKLTPEQQRQLRQRLPSE